jgi:hypothetical protein
MRALLPALLLTPACFWVSESDLADRQDALRDLDGDGFENANGDGTDCDDSDPDAYPGAQEIWYDGADQDCQGGDDYDADLDGDATLESGGDDCDDTDDDVHSGATEIWYDGVDQDCDGNDADRDGDGFLSVEVDGGDDCDDDDDDINPGEDEVWYDGVDQDCDDASDYDADQDGHDNENWGGDDCDDGDPDTYTGADEIWYDGVDQDCQGGNDYDADGDGYDAAVAGGLDCFDDDASRIYDGYQLGAAVPDDCGISLSPIDLYNSTDIIGPRLLSNNNYIGLAWGYEMAEDTSVIYDGLGAVLLDPDDLFGAPVDYILFSYDYDAGNFGEVLDFGLTDSFYIWSSSLLRPNPGAERQAWLDMFEIVTAGRADTGFQTAADDYATSPHDDFQLDVDPDGAVKAIVCEEGEGVTYVIQTTVDDAIADEFGVTYVAELPGAAGHRCEYSPGFESYVVASADARTLTWYSWINEEISELDERTAVDVRDIEASGEAMVVAEDVAGLMIWDAAGETTVPTKAPVERVDLAEDSRGRIYVCTVDEDGDAGFLYGTSAAGLEWVQLNTELDDIDDCAVELTPSGSKVAVSLRSGDEIAYSFAYTP